MRTIVFLLLFTATASALTNTPTLTVGAAGPVTPEWLGREMASVPACRASAAPLNAPPHTMVVEVDLSRGAVVKASTVTSSGDPAFDQKAVQCLQDLPQTFTTKIVGDLAMYVPLTSNNGAVVPLSDPSQTAVSMRPQHAPPSFNPGRPVHQCSAFYPPLAMRLDMEGDVTLRFTIATDGSVKDVSIEKSSGHDELDQAAVQCVAQWRYKPAMQNGAPVEVSWQTIIRFRLDNGPSPAMLRFERDAYRCLYAAMPNEDEMRKARRPTEIEVALRGDNTADVNVLEPSGNDTLDALAVQCFHDGRIDPEVAAAMAARPKTYLYVPWDTTMLKALAEVAQ